MNIIKQSLDELFRHLINGFIPGWDQVLSRLSLEQQSEILGRLARMTCLKIKDVGALASHLKIDKVSHRVLFDQMFFGFLCPVHDILVKSRRWDEALFLEHGLYNHFIKQDESIEFYERAFARIYEPYLKGEGRKENALATGKEGEGNSPSPLTGSADCASRGKVLFWFLNYARLAHMDLCLEFIEASSVKDVFCVAGLTEIDIEKTAPEFEKLGVKILKVGESPSLAERYRRLLELCRENQVTEIVFVSLPLHSAYLRKISTNINLVWWTMKFPLGALRQFHRRVCNRSLVPEIRTFNGAQWLCAPLVINKIPKTEATSDARQPENFCLKLGVLAREEKFISSDLPDVLKGTLEQFDRVALFWTGEKQNSEIEKRLHGDPHSVTKERTKFCGWVDPVKFLNFIDILVDTPNLGGLSAYWAMSIDKVVLSATDSGSVGALGSKETLRDFFCLLDSPEAVAAYFCGESQKPFYLSESSLIPYCVKHFVDNPELITVCGERFGNFFRAHLSNNAQSAATILSLIKDGGIS